MKRVPPRFDDKDAKRLLEKDRAGHWFSEISGNALLTITRPLFETGLKVHENAKRRGYLGNKQQRDQEAEDHNKWQTAADSIWLNRPYLSINDVAGKIAQRTGAKQETVRRHIKKPEATQ